MITATYTLVDTDEDGKLNGETDVVEVFETIEEGVFYLLQMWHEDDPRRTAYLFWSEEKILIATLVADPTDAEIAIFNNLSLRTTDRYHCVYVTQDGKTTCKVTKFLR